MPIDLGTAQAKYTQNTPASVGFWQQKAMANAPKWEANAKSPATEQYWAARVTEAAQRQARLRGLAAVTQADYSAGVQAGAGTFQAKTAGAGPKWAMKFEPYGRVIDTIVPGLAAKTPDVRTNVMNRVAPIAEALRNAKIGVGVARVLPTPTPLRAPFAPTPTPRPFTPFY